MLHTHTHVGSLYYAKTLYARASLYIDACLKYSSTPVITYQLSSYIAFNQVPTSAQLSHVNELLKTVQQQTGYRAGTITAVITHSLYIGGGLPPIHEKLILHF